MKQPKEYLDEISEIRSLMERSSRFLSLSGLSGVMAGLYALLGAFFAYSIIYQNNNYFGYRTIDLGELNTIKLLVLDALLVLIFSFFTGLLLTYKKAKKEGNKIWDKQAQQILKHLLIPLVTGGILSIILIQKGYMGVVAPLTLIFYGLALVNVSKFTYSDIQYLGLLEIALGLTSCVYIGYGLLFWSIGFGVLHILYGIIMYIKYEK
ncbi:hypothetical protein [Xanthovirga aplysinae]|uniref:hypothetical protein n=1 Tax=Xanthovirga aplysinae TaxID=2529853 RepID=UPI0012BB66E7|nr:hypothetical protein [Xanthovirga aplysinae]MTI33141.1 hypothetical protein [Xanthovirga aplysinae]